MIYGQALNQISVIKWEQGMTKPKDTKPQKRGRVIQIEQFLATERHKKKAVSWQLDDLDFWPLLSTCLLSLAVLADIGQKKKGGAITVGNPLWQAGVLLDFFVVSRIRHRLAQRQTALVPIDSLDNHILYVASQVQARMLGDLFISAPLDVPATIMQQAGYQSVTWFEDMVQTDERLNQALNPPARGMAALQELAYKQAWRPGTRQKIRRLPGFRAWCKAAAVCLGFSQNFLEIWLARQANIMLSTKGQYDKVFQQAGQPVLMVLLNAGFATTAGLTAAAHDKGIPVLEVHHGAESSSAVTAPGQTPHFSSFNTAPDALVSWALEIKGNPKDDKAILPVGPIGLHLPAVVAKLDIAGLPPQKALAKLIRQQRHALDSHADQTGCHTEILVSLQPGDNASWLAPIMQGLPDMLFWIRRHGADLNKETLSAVALKGNAESTLATRSILPLLLQRTSLHLTRFSAVTLEAGAMGIPTLATEAYARQLYQKRVAPDLLVIEKDITVIPAIIQKKLGGQKLHQHATLPDIQHIQSFIENLINKG